MAQKKIEKLTPAQERELIAYRQAWLDVGLSTEPVDRVAVREAIGDMYAEIGEQKPAVVVLPSPLACAFAIALLRLDGKKLGDQLGDQLSGQLRDQLGDQLSGQLWGQLGDQLWGQLWGQLSGQLGVQLGDQLWGQLWGQLSGQLWGQLWGQLGAQLRDQLGDQLSGQLGVQLGDQLGEGMNYALSASLMMGNWHSWWVAFYDFGEMIGVKYTAQARRRLTIVARAMRVVGSIYFPFRGICFVSDRPAAIKLQGDFPRARLHCSDGPALLFRDGYALWAHRGLRTTKQVITGQFAAADIDKELNAEIRRVMVEKLGAERYLRETNAELVSQDAFGKLWRKRQRGDEDLVMVEVRNSTPEPDGSVKDYFLRVHPQLRPLEPLHSNRRGYGDPQELTPRNAVASMVGMRGEDYRPAVET